MLSQTPHAREKFEKPLVLEIYFYWLAGKLRANMLSCKCKGSRGGKRSFLNDFQWIPPQGLNHHHNIQVLSSSCLCVITQIAEQHVSPVNLQEYLTEKAPHFHNSLSEKSWIESAPKVRSGAQRWMRMEKQGTGWRAAALLTCESASSALCPFLHCFPKLSDLEVANIWVQWACLPPQHQPSALESLRWEGGIFPQGGLCLNRGSIWKYMTERSCPWWTLRLWLLQQDL